MKCCVAGNRSCEIKERFIKEATGVHKDFLRKQVEAGMINADKNQDLFPLSVATCLQDARKNEKTVCGLKQALEHLEW